jgi:hypothetical protein
VLARVNVFCHCRFRAHKSGGCRATRQGGQRAMVRCGDLFFHSIKRNMILFYIQTLREEKFSPFVMVMAENIIAVYDYTVPL